MSREKRPANEAFGTSQLVKRTKPDANLDSSAVAKVNGSGANGALIQAVCTHQDLIRSTKAEDGDALTGTVGVARQRAAVASHGVNGPFWRGLRSTVRSDRAVHCFWIHGPFNMSVNIRIVGKNMR
jgi:hypothetical protein